MSNPDNNNQDEIQKNMEIDFIIKSNINLFKFSNLKSRAKLALSQYNSFNFDLSRKNLNEIKFSSRNYKIKGENGRYLNNTISEIPSSSKLSDEEFKNNFINNYEESYAHYCGLNKSQFIEIYINNKYIPNLNELGEINISINNNILEILKTYSASKRAKFFRNVFKRKKIKKNVKSKNLNLLQNKPKKIFRIFQLEKDEEVNNIKIEKESIKLNKNINNDNNYIKNDIKNNIQNKQEKNEENLIESQKSKTLLNIKKNLKNISIPGTINKKLNLDNISNSLYNKNNILNKSDLDSNFNNNLLLNEINSSNDNKKILSNNLNSQILTSNSNQNNSANLLFHPNLQTSNNNIFNFSSNIIKHFDNNDNNKNEILGKKLFTPFIDFGLNNIQTSNLNNNTPILKQVLSPVNLSPCLGNNILSPNSYRFLKSNISSPFLINASPFINNNEFNDKFTFNNVNTSSFYFGNNNQEINANNNDNTIINNLNTNENNNNIKYNDNNKTNFFNSKK